MDGESVQVTKRIRRSGNICEHKSPKTLSVLVLMGGPGGEREVSLQSGSAVAKALAEGGVEVSQSDIGPDDLGALERDGFDVIFPVLHGTFGEDGQLQEIMEQRGLCFAGSDSVSSRRAMNKQQAKQAFVRADVLTPLAEFIKAGEGKIGQVDFDLRIEQALEIIGLPGVIKPNSQGSSLGVVIARNETEAWEAIEQVLKEHGDCLIERFVGGRELTVGILGDKILPVLEVKPARGFYDYQAKYLDDNTQYLFDIDLPAELLVQCQRQARRAFEVLGCRDFGRVDMIVDHWGRAFILEVNTIPGFTEHSLLPKAAARAGITMPQICAEIVRMAHARSI